MSQRQCALQGVDPNCEARLTLAEPQIGQASGCPLALGGAIPNSCNFALPFSDIQSVVHGGEICWFMITSSTPFTLSFFRTSCSITQSLGTLNRLG